MSSLGPFMGMMGGGGGGQAAAAPAAGEGEAEEAPKEAVEKTHFDVELQAFAFKLCLLAGCQQW